LGGLLGVLPEEMTAAMQVRKKIEPTLETRIKWDGAHSGGRPIGGAPGKPPLMAAVEHQLRRPKSVGTRRSGIIVSSVLKRLFLNLTSEPIRILCMQLVLAPSAYLLPKRWALTVAKVLALSLVILPSPGVITYCRMRRAFGEGRLRSFQLAWESIARPFKDFVTLKRVLYGREDVFRWRIIERNSAEVSSLRKTGRSFIVATAHFQRAALLVHRRSQKSPDLSRGMIAWRHAHGDRDRGRW
jgi:hypothetical protein